MMIDWGRYAFDVGPLWNWGGGTEVAAAATVADAYLDYAVATGPPHFVIATTPCHYAPQTKPFHYVGEET